MFYCLKYFIITSIFRSATTNHVITSYIELYIFANIFYSECTPISVSCRRKPIKFCSSGKEVVKIMFC